MIRVRKSNERGHADHGWLKSQHSFSFANYYDEEYMGFRALRVLNEDRVAPGAGFPTHPHRNMEILSYVVEGALEHRDSMGTGSVIRPGELQRMSAGTGVTHSEYNHSHESPVHFLQIWLTPEDEGGAPEYEQKMFGDELVGTLRIVASKDGRDGSLRVRQDVSLFASALHTGEALSYELLPTRHAWIQVVRGTLDMCGVALSRGDGAALQNQTDIKFEAQENSEFLLFDLA
ncbi:MAG: pirin family protein [Myxococcota bacterium]